MSTELVLRRDYLVDHRRLILGRALAGAVAGFVPVPFVDDWLLRQVLGSGYRRIACDHQLDLTPSALANLVHGRAGAPSFPTIALVGILGRVAKGGGRRAIVLYTLARRAQAAAHRFTTMTLFDHYCARRHVGFGLDGEEAMAVNDAIERAIANTAGSIALAPFKRGVVAAARASVKAPLQLLDVATAGRLRTLRGKRRDVIAADTLDDVDQAIDHEMNRAEGFLGRAVMAVELHLSADVNPYLERVIEAFDETWVKP